ncbi:hypothetical protein [Actinoplanes sp. NPDC051411]|uniref:hypothetical protein n=1 Tax=Actinoplanes sp. NPDC051411 TaxID=3155522 RepID=UPI003435BC66
MPVVTQPGAATGPGLQYGVTVQVEVSSIDGWQVLHEPAVYRFATPMGPLWALLRPGRGEILHVFFSCAIDRAQIEAPYFHRVAASARLAGPVLFLSDPALNLAPDVPSGWFAGTPGYDLPADIERLIARAQDRLGTPRLVCFGASAGGYAALVQSARVPGSLAVPVNPQTDVRKRATSRRFREVAWAGRFPDPAPTGDRFSILPTYLPGAFGNTVCYLQNRGDRLHVDRHLTPLAAQLGVPLTSGAQTADGRFQLRLLDNGLAHAPIPDVEFWPLYDGAIARWQSAGPGGRVRSGLPDQRRTGEQNGSGLSARTKPRS